MQGCKNSILKNEKYIDYTENKDLYSQRIRTLSKDSKGKLWIGTTGAGLIIYEKDNEDLTLIKNDPSQFKSLSDNNITYIFEDYSGILWIGTRLAGLNKLPLDKNKFELFRNNPSNPNSLMSNNITSLLKDEEGIIWAGTSEGLNSYDREKDIWKNHTEISPLGRSVGSLYEDKEGNIWIGTLNSLVKFNKSSGSIKKYYPSHDINLYINNILSDKDGNIWIGSAWFGMFRFDPQKEIFTEYSFQSNPISNGINSLLSNRIFALYEDREGFIWIGTDNGLSKLNKSSGKFEHFINDPDNPNSLSNNFAETIYEDKNGSLWIGTYGGGLNKFDKKSKKFIHFTESNGLPNNVVYGILPDNNSNLWLSTNKGLCKFNLSNSSVRNYDVSDGLQSYEFNGGAYFKSADGEMFFGGVNGFNSFYPKKVIDKSILPKIVITSINILDKEIRSDIAISSKEKIELPYNQNFISFEFVSLDYTNSRKNKYAYKLEGVDLDWVHSKERRFAAYTNLDPGEYIFIVKGSNNNEIWNEAGVSVSFIINPPFWRTWWFYTLTTLAFIVMIASIHKYRLRSKIKQLEEIENIRKSIADDFHDELGHKLTKISLYSELMRRNLNGEPNGNEDYLKKINEAANTLFDDTKDFIWALDPVKDTLYDLAVYLKDFGDELFDKTGIAFRVKEISYGLQNTASPMNWKRQLILIFKEAMNNILKHSNAKNVELSVEINEKEIEIILSDDGKGFENNSNGSGRGLNNMNYRAERIGGILRVNSKTSEGTEIIFTFDKTKLTSNLKTS